MKYSKKADFKGLNEWEYESERKKEKKVTKMSRQMRRDKRNIWNNSSTFASNGD